MALKKAKPTINNRYIHVVIISSDVENETAGILFSLQTESIFCSTIIVVAKNADLAANLAGWEFRGMEVYVGNP